MLPPTNDRCGALGCDRPLLHAGACQGAPGADEVVRDHDSAIDADIVCQGVSADGMESRLEGLVNVAHAFERAIDDLSSNGKAYVKGFVIKADDEKGDRYSIARDVCDVEGCDVPESLHHNVACGFDGDGDSPGVASCPACRRRFRGTAGFTNGHGTFCSRYCVDADSHRRAESAEGASGDPSCPSCDTFPCQCVISDHVDRLNRLARTAKNHGFAAEIQGGFRVAVTMPWSKRNGFTTTTGTAYLYCTNARELSIALGY